MTSQPESVQPSEINQPVSQPAPSRHEFSPELEAEIDAALRHMDAMDAPRAHRGHDQHGRAVPEAVAANARPAAIRGPRVVQAGREHRHGKVVAVGPTDIFVEFGPKELGVLSRQQYPEDKDLPVVGADLEVVIDKYEAGENVFLCSRPGAIQKADWEMLEAGQVVEARVTGVVQGKDNKQAGLELEVAGHRAFMPASQVSADRVPDLSVFVGEKLKCQVARVERMGKGNIVLSRRDIIAQERKENAERLKATLKEGETVEGTVRKIMPFGAFVDLGGVDGLIHLSDLTYDRVGFGEKAVQKYVQEGQGVRVRILKLDFEANRISLGLKQVAGDPFTTAAQALVEGAEVSGRVVRIAEFGAFVEVAPGVEGLVHISEIDYKRIARVEDALKVDEVVRCKVLKIDPSNRRVSLSIKALKPAPEAVPGQKDKGGKKDRFGGRSAEEILKETPALRRAREKHKQFQFKGGLG
ncbi:MAG TPA: S1 RNA-binding domain-containing protein [Phycisphaerales bacterium]|nr:S1 RNA-binding domain-containing protein [Phycisphaerales bacterium]